MPYRNRMGYRPYSTWRDNRFLFCFVVFLFSVTIYIFAKFNDDFAEVFARYPSHYLRAAFGLITSLIPFSLAETILILFIPFAVCNFIHSESVFKNEGNDAYKKKLTTLICIILAFISAFMLTLGVCYFRKPLEENLYIERNDVSVNELCDTADIISGKINELLDDITFSSNDCSRNLHSFSETSMLIYEAYDSFCEEYSFIDNFYSLPKTIALSDPMTYTHISGVYAFFTGESNVNTNYPDYVTAYTIAHEMAHQRGIAKEDEANFVAYLVCLESDDAYIQYAAYVSMLDYLLDAIYSADKEAYNDVYDKLDIKVKYEYYAFSLFFKKYTSSTASKVTGAVNNVFLQSQGQEEGTRSYGTVVDLTVAYYK